MHHRLHHKGGSQLKTFPAKKAEGGSPPGFRIPGPSTYDVLLSLDNPGLAAAVSREVIVLRDPPPPTCAYCSTMMPTDFDGMPLAITTSVLSPNSVPEDVGKMSNMVLVTAPPVATAMVLWS
jgi:hypothetical protein